MVRTPDRYRSGLLSKAAWGQATPLAAMSMEEKEKGMERRKKENRNAVLTRFSFVNNYSIVERDENPLCTGDIRDGAIEGRRGSAVSDTGKR